MINFNKNSAWDLKPINISDVRSEINGLLINGEEIVDVLDYRFYEGEERLTLTYINKKDSYTLM